MVWREGGVEDMVVVVYIASGSEVFEWLINGMKC